MSRHAPWSVSETVAAAFAYHDVTDDPRESGFQWRGAAPYTIGRVAFRSHIEAMATAYRRPALVTAIDFAAPGRHLLLTFDDGGKSALAVGDELSRRGWLGHFFIVTGRIGDATFLDAAGIRYLRRCGHVIGSHSHTHPNIFREQTLAQMITEWRTSCDRLADLLGEPCAVASVPGGDISPAVLESAAAAGLKYLYTSEPSLVPRLVHGCRVLGRYHVKLGTAPERIAALARLEGWRTAVLVRRLKGLLRDHLPGLYRSYVRYTTREALPG